MRANFIALLMLIIMSIISSTGRVLADRTIVGNYTSTTRQDSAEISPRQLHLRSRG